MFGRCIADFVQENKMVISKFYKDDHSLTVLGTLDKTDVPYRGVADFPREREYPFWYYPDERTIYWDNDKGATNNIWRDGQCFPGC